MSTDSSFPKPGINARQKLKALGSPMKIQKSNLNKMLDWIYRWGCTTPALLSVMLGRQNRSHAKRLADQGWIRITSMKGCTTYCTLTEKGLNEAIRNSGVLLEYKEIDPGRVHLPTLHHNLVVQAETIAALKTDRFYDYRTPRMFDYTSENAPKKVPDVVWLEEFIDASGEGLASLTLEVAVEIELTPKWNHHLDLAITNIVDDIQSQRFSICIYISDSKAILARYQDAFSPGKRVKIWKSCDGKKKHQDTGEVLTLPQWTPRFIEFRQVGSTTAYMTNPNCK